MYEIALKEEYYESSKARIYRYSVNSLHDISNKFLDSVCSGSKEHRWNKLTIQEAFNILHTVKIKYIFLKEYLNKNN